MEGHYLLLLMLQLLFYCIDHPFFVWFVFYVGWLYFGLCRTLCGAGF